MKTIIIFFILSLTATSLFAWADDSSVTEAYSNQISDIQVQGNGKVIKLLADDNDGSRHQRFIIQLMSGQTLLVAHNIDLAPRLENLSIGDQVEFNGEYVWNNKGGVIHWTHKDPRGNHTAGWLVHKGKQYD
jgi:hypothetical protein